MRPTFKPAGLKKTKPWEYAVRFVFGGLVTMAAGLVADRFGPEIGGLMLAFPAILPASLTLVKYHDGRAKAVDDARGARLGSLALATFGLPVWFAARSWPPAIVLAVATVAWIAVAVSLWALEYGGGPLAARSRR
jgi:Protein of unknown function (DUF3147)